MDYIVHTQVLEQYEKEYKFKFGQTLLLHNQPNQATAMAKATEMMEGDNEKSYIEYPISAVSFTEWKLQILDDNQYDGLLAEIKDWSTLKLNTYHEDEDLFLWDFKIDAIFTDGTMWANGEGRWDITRHLGSNGNKHLKTTHPQLVDTYYNHFRPMWNLLWRRYKSDWAKDQMKSLQMKKIN